MAAEFEISQDRGWLVVTITRPRHEAARLAWQLQKEVERLNSPA